MAKSFIEHRVVHGHFLTRKEAAVAAGMPADKLQTLPGVIRIEGRYDAEEAYPAVQFLPQGGFVPGIREVVVVLEDHLSPMSITGWISAGRSALGGMSVVAWLGAGRPAARVEQLLATGSRSVAAA